MKQPIYTKKRNGSWKMAGIFIAFLGTVIAGLGLLDHRLDSIKAETISEVNGKYVPINAYIDVKAGMSRLLTTSEDHSRYLKSLSDTLCKMRDALVKLQRDLALLQQEFKLRNENRSSTGKTR